MNKNKSNNINSLLRDLGYNVHYVQEPENSTNILINLEKKYKLNTKDILEYNNDLSKDVQKEWLRSYDNFQFFFGRFKQN